MLMVSGTGFPKEKFTDTRSFLEEHPELLPKLDADREALIRQAYSEKIDREATWAAGRMTGSDRKWHCGSIIHIVFT